MTLLLFFTFCVLLVLFVTYIGDMILGKQIIRDANGEVYMVRYFIWRPDWLDKFGIDSKKAGRVYLHHMLKSDHDRALHDHPWSFISIIVKGGYREYTHLEDVTKFAGKVWPRRVEWKFVRWPLDRRSLYSKEYFGAGTIIKRPAAWRHRVELKPGQSSWSLVFIGPKVRSWGFWPNGKFCWWRNYNTGTGLCEETD